MTRQEILDVLNRLPNASLGDYGRIIVTDTLYPDSKLHFVAVRVCDFRCDIFLPIIRWIDHHTPELASRLWQSTRLPEIDSATKVLELVEAGIEARRRQFKKCRFCNGDFAPEHISEDKVCMGCAYEQFGIIS